MTALKKAFPLGMRLEEPPRLVQRVRAAGEGAGGGQFISSASAGIGRTPTPSSMSARVSLRLA